MKRTILLADDSPTIQRLVTQTFADVDFKIVSVSNGDAAVRKFDEIHPDIVLADIYMPGRDGFEVCRYVRSQGGSHPAPVVLLVGAFDAFDEGSASKAGAAAHITKPFEPQALVNLVVSLLQPQEAAAAPAEQLDEELPAERGDAVVVGPAAEPASDLVAEPAEPISEPAAEHVLEPLAAPFAEHIAEEPVAEPAAELLAQAAAAAATSLGIESPEQAEEAPAAAPPPVPAVTTSAAEEGDLMGLQELFKPPVQEPAPLRPVSDAEIDRIAERVLQKLSAQVIENVAWDVVPDITSKILRDELKRNS